MTAHRESPDTAHKASRHRELVALVSLLDVQIPPTTILEAALNYTGTQRWLRFSGTPNGDTVQMHDGITTHDVTTVIHRIVEHPTIATALAVARRTPESIFSLDTLICDRKLRRFGYTTPEVAAALVWTQDRTVVIPPGWDIQIPLPPATTLAEIEAQAPEQRRRQAKRAVHEASPLDWLDTASKLAELIADGRLQELPFPLPPLLVASTAYRGPARLLGMWWMSGGDELETDDGVFSGTALHWRGYLAFVQHHGVAQHLPKSILSAFEASTRHILVADRDEERLYIAPVDVGRALLRFQWLHQHEAWAAAIHALGIDLNAMEPVTVMALIRDALHRKPPEVHIDLDLHELIDDEMRLVSRLVAWLDKHVPPLDPLRPHIMFRDAANTPAAVRSTIIWVTVNPVTPGTAR